MKLYLPPPSSAAFLISQKLKEFIIHDIQNHNGWISFARYMELVLYTPNLGYYSNNTEKLGGKGDFITAPEISSLFGKTLARLMFELFQDIGVSAIMEFGAGTGKLAFDILMELQNIDCVLQYYYIVEISAQLRERQKVLLQNFPQVKWLDYLPKNFSGIVIANEVLDAMPINLIIYSKKSWLERGVALDNVFNFIYTDRICNKVLFKHIPNISKKFDGYLTEVHHIATCFMRSLASMLQNGKAVALLFDYGFSEIEYYIPERYQGTLMCHYQHHAHCDPFYLPGLQDITSHINFTAIARAALEGGLELLSYINQAGLLLNAGITEVLLNTSLDKQVKYLSQANAVNKLISPAEMGELFKVLIVGKSIEWPQKMTRYDRSYSLCI